MRNEIGFDGEEANLRSITNDAIFLRNSHYGDCHVVMLKTKSQCFAFNCSTGRLA